MIEPALVRRGHEVLLLIFILLLIIFLIVIFIVILLLFGRCAVRIHAGVMTRSSVLSLDASNSSASPMAASGLPIDRV